LILRSKILAEYVPRGEKEAKRTSNFKDCCAFHTIWQCPQLEVLCQAFFQESGKRKKEQKELQTLRTAVLFTQYGNALSLKFFAKLSFKKAEKEHL
jgi:hypothetical protein